MARTAKQKANDKRLGEQARARAAEKKLKEDPPQTSNDDVASLLRRIEEMEKQRFFSPAPQQAVRAITKYSINSGDYPDPRERLFDESRLEEHAFKQNFILEWNIGRVNYDKDGVNYTEPKFVLEIWRWKRDPETNQLTNKKYRIHKFTFFEDPDAALQLAQEKGLDIDDRLQKPFLDEMRYLRIRDTLFEIFYPAPMQKPQVEREEVIGNQLVPVIEVSSVEAQDVAEKL